jgi:hypothetical protein
MLVNDPSSMAKQREDSYWIIHLVILAQCRRYVVDFFNHVTQILTHLIKAFR